MLIEMILNCTGKNFKANLIDAHDESRIDVELSDRQITKKLRVVMWGKNWGIEAFPVDFPIQMN